MEHPLFNQIQTTLKEVLDYIAKFEKLSPQEGVIKIIYGVNEKGVEIFAPHFVPQALSYTWTADSFDKAFEMCLKDISSWYEVEKDAPRSKFWLDME